jgi:transposase InsO family protein
MTADLATSAQRSPDGTMVVHSDSGSQFRSRSFRAVLKANQLTVSSRRVASVDDDAAIESFYDIESIKERNE